MLAIAVGALLGASTLIGLAELPPQPWYWLLLPASAGLVARSPLIRCFAAAVAGFAWAALWAHAQLDQRLPAALEGQETVVTGRVVGLPEAGPRAVRFDLRLDADSPTQARWPGRPRIRITWYDDAPPLAPGQRWRLPVKLKAPRGYSNPGGFDYERWLFRRGVDATGYVRGEGARQLAPAPRWQLDGLRAALAARVDAALDGEHAARLLRALTVGDRRGLDDTDWDVLAATGTSHLMAISGLHVGLMAGLGMLLGRALGWLFPWLIARLPARQVGAVLALALAGAYAALAGFSLPTQRALVMVGVALGAWLMRRRLSAFNALGVAAVAVLAVDPLAPMSVGFWLSFTAVAALIYAFAHRPRPSRGRGVVRAQAVAVVGLLPLTLLFFGRTSLLAPLVNLVAIPWVGLAVLPPALGGAALLTAWPAAGAVLLDVAAATMAPLWQGLAALAAQPGVLARFATPAPWTLVTAAAGVLWLLSPGGLRGKALAPLLLLPLALPPAAELRRGELAATVLDVGQGLAVVVRTRQHVLVYDAGPRYPSGFGTGEAVVVPFLRDRGVSGIDRFIVSHGDNDHAGGARAVVEAYPGTPVLTGAVERLAERLPGAEPCQAGQSWQWDGVRFKVLHPHRGLPYLGNDSSCVLHIQGRHASLLLPGDITAPVEKGLALNAADDLPADVLVAAHHGSASSSVRGFVAAVAPQRAVFSAGYRNRFGMPAPEVVARFREHGATLSDTAAHGAVTLRSTAAGMEVRHHREAARRFWHAPAGDVGRR